MTNVFEYIRAEEMKYQQNPVTVIEGYEWSMFKHCKLTTLYLNSIYESGKSDDKPFKNIILDKVNLQHRAVDFSVKDVDAYVENPDLYYKSLLTRKFHAKWARRIGLGDFLDELAETFTDFGGVLVKKNVRGAKPEVIPFTKIAFVDQTDMVNNPICIRHFYTPEMLMAENWDKDETKTLITLAGEQNTQKSTAETKQRIDTPSIYIEVYELHGMLPKQFLDESAEEFEYERQMHIVGFYKDQDGKKQGISLFKGTQKDNLFKARNRDEIKGRALGRGGVEELFEDQVWVNYNEIQQKALLDQASKILYQTSDTSFTTRNKKLADLGQGDILIHDENKPLTQVNTQAINFPMFVNATERWDNHAKTVSSAFDSLSGEAPKSGTPFRALIMSNQEGHSMHKYRKQKLGRFIEELYRDWIVEWLAKEMLKEQTFMDTLSQEEMEEIAINIANQEANKVIKEKFFNLQTINQTEIDAIKDSVKQQFMAGGNKRFLKILKDELKGLPIDVQVVITDEQRNNAFMADKLSSVFAQVAQNPAILEDPYTRKLFNEIMELSGLSPVQYTPRPKQIQQVESPITPLGAPPKESVENNAVGATAQ